jgi:hypothetical protein
VEHRLSHYGETNLGVRPRASSSGGDVEVTDTSVPPTSSIQQPRVLRRKSEAVSTQSDVPNNDNDDYVEQAASDMLINLVVTPAAPPPAIVDFGDVDDGTSTCAYDLVSPSMPPKSIIDEHAEGDYQSMAIPPPMISPLNDEMVEEYGPVSGPVTTTNVYDVYNNNGKPVVPPSVQHDIYSDVTGDKEQKEEAIYADGDMEENIYSETVDVNSKDGVVKIEPFKNKAALSDILNSAPPPMESTGNHFEKDEETPYGRSRPLSTVLDEAGAVYGSLNVPPPPYSVVASSSDAPLVYGAPPPVPPMNASRPGMDNDAPPLPLVNHSTDGSSVSRSEGQDSLLQSDKDKKREDKRIADEQKRRDKVAKERARQDKRTQKMLRKSRIGSEGERISRHSMMAGDDNDNIIDEDMYDDVQAESAKPKSKSSLALAAFNSVPPPPLSLGVPPPVPAPLDPSDSPLVHHHQEETEDEDENNIYDVTTAVDDHDAPPPLPSTTSRPPAIPPPLSHNRRSHAAFSAPPPPIPMRGDEM